ncbi:MAG: 3-phosphoglycerate dehydrogenase [Acidobacteria bacterium]|jgi:phosphoglycerate dehydrogenase-like enzyme|nr:3-phosphoglycerate dehydrogenase [Acidobacteriota bacterium]
MSPRPPLFPGQEIVVACASPADPGLAAVLARRPGVRFVEYPPLSGAALAAAAAGAEVLVTRAWQRLDRTVVDAAGDRLRAIVQGSAGLDNIDHAAAAGRGIEIVAVDPGNATAVAELTLLSLIALWRGLPAHWAATASGVWPDRERLPDRELAGKTVGLVGLGRVGTRVSRRARACEMTVLAVDPYIDGRVFTEVGAERVATLEDLLPRCDALSLHCPLTAETRGMIGAVRLARLPRGAIVINTARGGIVDETALQSALDAGHVAGAALDVFEREPVSIPGIAAHPRVLATPHLAGHTVESHAARARHLAEALDELVGRWIAEGTR